MTRENVGDKPRLRMEFRSEGKLTDPTTITFVMLEPDGTKTTYTYALNPTVLVKDATGKYYVDYTIDQAGIHKFPLRAAARWWSLSRTNFWR